MEEDYEYLKSKSMEELLKVIDDFNDMNETVEAIDILSDMNSTKAFEKGIKFLWDNAGDEYFQAMIIDIIDYIDFDKVLNCLTHRKDNIQAYLLGEVMNEMVIYSSNNCVNKYIDVINDKYKLISEKEKKRIDEKYKNFIQEFQLSI